MSTSGVDGHPGSPRGRARIPGRHGDPAPADAYRRTGGEPPGRVGPAAEGTAPVGRPGRVPMPPAAGGRAGRATVGGAPAGAAPAGGRARVGGSAAVGARASVARATVPPAAGGPGGPAGPVGPGGGRRGAGGPAAARPPRRKRKRLNTLVAGFAVLIMLAGLGVVGFTWYSTRVVLPNEVPLPLSTTVYAADGKSIVAKLGSENRTFVTIDQIPQHVQDAVAAAEDRNFYKHSGVDYKGIARAAWNNFIGGDKQGASTITQQYARNAFDNLQDDTYGRKVKEAILASKLNDKYTKPQIMQHYLNVIYFGRGAYGIEAAAQTYFNTSAAKLTPAQGAVLAALIKQPVASQTHQGYDPAVNPTDARSRWQYVIDGMVAEGWLGVPGRPDRPTEYPKVLPPPKDGNGFGVKTPSGNVVNYVRQELEQWGICSDSGAPGKPACVDELRDGGYRIKTTIDWRLQKALEAAAQPDRKGSVLHGQPKNLMAAAVSIDPGNGRVLAYYGGDSGADFDYAGKNTNANGDIVGGHPPGSSFKVYTLAAAIDAGISVKSHWDATPFKPSGFKDKVQNAGRGAGVCGKWCTLEESTIRSYNVPFFHVTEEIGPDRVVEMAKRAGVGTMWTVDPPKPYDLTASEAAELAPRRFDRVVGYGQYPITVLDHANGLATLANDGKYNKAHFVLSVEKQDKTTGEWVSVPGTGEKLHKTGGQQRIRAEVAREVTAVLKEIPEKNNADLDGGRDAAGKTGTWEHNGTPRNAHAWMVGYDRNVATAVWVGSRDAKKPTIVDDDGNDIGGSSFPAKLWKRYMDTALKGKANADLPTVTGMGDADTGNGTEPAPPSPPPIQPSTPPGCDPLCPPDDDGNGNGNGPPTVPTLPATPPPVGIDGTGGGLLPTTPPRTTRGY
ncbi:transglycosylase domain-containing protein [Micromonospora sp. C28SCA-DRY-2]|uniref:transglycosylase domain-containing protein n=1 Tax=Micromonospora sp. C28SCA-DRY-2 TaxID=3059522 RepID=UPI0026759C48|nr:transglycosylase domain-containing protein [Micromonospora sp. C28SCA-DRY-2]MDO3705567.1 transglycosylase domain-containing protein [Micromonospora sp. C28SCA-DRY-2]